jgi:formylglycine-generating enzyme required for sulfatase activity
MPSHPTAWLLLVAATASASAACSYFDTAIDAGVADNDPDGDDGETSPEVDAGDTEVEDSDTPTETDGSDTPDVISSPNACGGSGALTFDGAPATPGDACGCGGQVVCNGTDRLSCAGQERLNVCGSCGALDDELGDACGVCGDGVWQCAAGRLECAGASAGNLCGGCTPLGQALRAPCEDGGETGRFRCDGTDLVVCETQPEINECGGSGALQLAGIPVAPGDTCAAGCGDGVVYCDGLGGAQCRGPGPNACGGCELLLGDVGQACGCGEQGRWRCDESTDQVVCDGGESNACGGCGELSPAGALPGELCDAGVRICTGSDTTSCLGSGSSACGGTASLSAVPGTPCGACDSGEYTCTSVDEVRCTGDLGAQAFNNCGGCAPLPALEDTACGACGSGSWTCDGEDTLTCVGDEGELALNLCGGCESLAASPGDDCGECASWACRGTTLRCDPNPALPGCSTLERSCEELDCDAVARVCDEGEVGQDAFCAGCADGFREERGACVPTECADSLDCAPVVTAWSDCDWVDVCDEASERTRTVTPQECLDGVCVNGTATEQREDCEPRATDGEDCGSGSTCVGGVCLATPPTVVTNNPSPVTDRTAQLNATLTALGSAAATTDAGFCWRQTSSPTGCAGPSVDTPCGDGWTLAAVGPVSVGAYSTTIGGLTPGAAHRTCAWVAAGTTIGHGTVQSFATTTTTPAGGVCTDDGSTTACATGWCGNGRCTTPGFQYIPGGTDLLGAPSSELGTWDDERPQHTVTLSPFELMRYEVTQSEWFAVAGLNPSYFQTPTCTDGSCASNENNNPTAPVENLDWYSAIAFANARSRADGLAECYTLTGCTDAANGWQDGVHSGCTGATFAGLACDGYRLPTEAEWEYAARAGTDGATWLGALTAEDCTDTRLPSIAWFCGNSGGRTRAVGSLGANPWGLRDVLGNAGEWCWDWFGTYEAASITDPVGASAGTARLIRGGAWYFGASSARAAFRGNSNPANRSIRTGFRLARSLP